MYSFSLGLYSINCSGSMASSAARSDSMTDRRSDCWDQRLLLASLDPIGVARRMEALLATAAFQSLRFFNLELLRVAMTLASLPKTSIGLSDEEPAITELIKSSTIPIWNPFFSRRSRSRPFFPPTTNYFMKNACRYHNKNRDICFDIPLIDLPPAMPVFMPFFCKMSISSKRKDEMSCLISFTSSSVTPISSLFFCSAVTKGKTISIINF